MTTIIEEKSLQAFNIVLEDGRRMGWEQYKAYIQGLAHPKLDEGIRQSIVELIKRCHDYAVSQGFWGGDPDPKRSVGYSIPEDTKGIPCLPPTQVRKNFGEALFLVTTELSEAYEGWRKGVPVDDLEEGAILEIADAFIRLFDLLGAFDPDLFARVLLQKMEKNKRRPYMHNKRS